MVSLDPRCVGVKNCESFRSVDVDQACSFGMYFLIITNLVTIYYSIFLTYVYYAFLLKLY